LSNSEKEESFDDINKNRVYNKSTRVLSIIKNWFDNNLLQLNLTKTCFINFSLNKLSLTGNNYLKAHQINYNEFNMNTVTAINDGSKCKCTSISSVQKIKYLDITINANLKWQNHIINTAGKLDYYSINFKPLATCYHPLP